MLIVYLIVSTICILFGFAVGYLIGEDRGYKQCKQIMKDLAAKTPQVPIG